MPELAKGHLKPNELDELLKKYKEGDEEAFDEIYHDTYYSVYYTIYLLNHNHSQITDLVQETYLRMLNNLDKYQMGTNLRAWLCTIARNITINDFKKNRHEFAFSEIDDTKLPYTYSNWELDYQIETFKTENGLLAIKINNKKLNKEFTYS